ncbi:MAG: preprotein translocase subunit YajC [Muribaculaceae bacterium]|nr:preprotein translocase subunit YajC [Muribaculaceae bacterium]
MLNNFILLQAASGEGSGMTSLIMIVLLIVIFYFFMIRPQSQKQKKINQFRQGLQKGDKVMTAGGIYGKIREVKDKVVVLEITKGVDITIDINSVYQSAQDVAETGADPSQKQ